MVIGEEGKRCEGAWSEKGSYRVAFAATNVGNRAALCFALAPTQNSKATPYQNE